VYRLFLRVRKETQRATEPWMDEAIGEMFAVPAVEEAPRERVSA
jgi:hypothetical protein